MEILGAKMSKKNPSTHSFLTIQSVITYKLHEMLFEYETLYNNLQKKFKTYIDEVVDSNCNE